MASDSTRMLTVKLRSASKPADHAAVIEAARQAGAREVRRLAPESRDADLACLYVVELPATRASVKRVERALEALACVEFVEPAVSRHLL
jgi:hypothetical protein